MPSRKKRKRDRRRTAGGDREAPPSAGGSGGGSARTPLLDDWATASVESVALVRRAIAEEWPTENGAAILEQLTGGVEPGRNPDAIRLSRLVLELERM